MNESYIDRMSPPTRSQSGSRNTSSPALTEATSPMSPSFMIPEPPSPSHPLAGPARYYTKNKHDEYTIAGPPALTWRLDPDESLSDWTLTVVSSDTIGETKESDLKHSDMEDDAEPCTMSPRSAAISPSSMHATQKYFVHRTQLAVGPRRCEYFAKLFRGKESKSVKSGGTRIELRPSAARAFPQMLDFVYAPVGSPPDVTTETAVALRHLATCFGIRELFDSVTAFIKRDLSPEKAPVYLLEAETFRHDKLIDLTMSLCAENFESIKFSRLVTLPPELFERVVTSPELQCSSEVLSARVASYCRCRPGMVDADMLKRLTDPKIMARVAPEESIFFLRLLVEMQSDEESSVTSSSTRGRTYDLYRRCVEASTEVVQMAMAHQADSSHSRSGHGNRQNRHLLKEYHGLPATMKVDLLEHALVNTPSSHGMNDVERVRLEESKANRALQQASEMKEEMQNVCDMYESKLKTYEAAIETQEGELRALAQELAKFKRVPNDHRIKPLLSEYTYQEKLEYDEFGESMYGQVPPSALPFGDQNANGWVYREAPKDKPGRHDDQCWPVYYYHGNS